MRPSVTPAILPNTSTRPWLASPGALVFAWLVTAAILVALASAPSHPTVFPDELANLSWARFLSGTGPHYVMDMATYRHPIYPALLAPIFWLFSDPADIYRGIFFFNTLLVASCLPLAVRLAVDGFGLKLGQAWLVGLMVMAYPAATLVNHHAWPESALFPGVLIGLLAFSAWANRPDWRRATWLAIACAGLYALHPKMLIFPLAFLGGVALGLVRHPTPAYRLRALVTILAFSALFLVFNWLGPRLAEQLWHPSPVDVVGRFTQPRLADLLTAVLSKVAGQLVYATIITGGLIWLVLATALQSVSRLYRQGPTALGQDQKITLFLAAMLMLMAVETGIFLAMARRFDTLFYGRHIDPFLAGSLVPALALLWKRESVSRTTALIATALIGSCAILLVATLPLPDWNDFSRVHVQGIRFLMELMWQTHGRASLLLLCALLLSAGGLAVLGASAKRYRWMGLIPLISVLILSHATNRPFTGVPSSEALPLEVRSTLLLSEPCQIAWDGRIRDRLANHQFFRLQYQLPHCRIEMKGRLTCEGIANAETFSITTEKCPSDTAPLALPPDLLLFRPRVNSTLGDERTLQSMQ